MKCFYLFCASILLANTVQAATMAPPQSAAFSELLPPVAVAGPADSMSLTAPLSLAAKSSTFVAGPTVAFLDPSQPAGPLPPPFIETNTVVHAPVGPSLLGLGTALAPLLVLARRRARHT